MRVDLLLGFLFACPISLLGDEARLFEKLLKIESLRAGATTECEKKAAALAWARIMERLRVLRKEAPEREYRFSMADEWSRKVFCALLRRYEIEPYRYKGQRYTTVMARMPKRFLDETLWPEYLQFSKTLEEYLSEVTDKVVAQVLRQEAREAGVFEKPRESPPPPQKQVTATAAPEPDLTPTTSTSSWESSGQPVPEATHGTGAEEARRMQRNKDKKKRKKGRR